MLTTIHNPDQYMTDLRQALAQGRKRLGLLLGAGAPASVKVDQSSGLLSDNEQPLIPTTRELTDRVLGGAPNSHRAALDAVLADLGGTPDIETVLSRIRSLADVLGANLLHSLDGSGYARLADDLCKRIGSLVQVSLPFGVTPYSELASWIGGVPRAHAVEIFTCNYDLLIEEALERAKVPYFDGFCGSREPFFDPATIANADLPPRWARIWKLHGSLGWKPNDSGEVVRSGGTSETSLIFPTHLKYDQTQKLPYSALFDRLRGFLRQPDTMLLACGFSFRDAHVSAVIEEALSSTPATSVIAFQHATLTEEKTATSIAERRSNLSVYANDGATINGVAGR
ncbi:MAG TPA: SIR2 family protein, partial [Candidatus Acidoferrales bacterium]|nr:SIR2 family protein [Candidatus Acidoferrales bacterium]